MADRKIQETVAKHRQAIQLNPKFPWHYYLLGEALEKLGELVEAIAQYTKAIELGSESAVFYHALGKALLKNGRLKEAVLNLQKAVDVSPDVEIYQQSLVKARELWSNNRDNLGQNFLTEGKVDEAIAWYEETIKLMPQNPEYHEWLGAALEIKGNLSAAVINYQNALNLYPETHPSYNWCCFKLGQFLAKLGQADEAISYYHRAIELEAGKGESHEWLGGALEGKGDLEGAIASYEKAVELYPENHSSLGWCYYRIGTFQAQLCRLDRAIANYQKAIKLNPELYASQKQTVAETIPIFICGHWRSGTNYCFWNLDRDDRIEGYNEDDPKAFNAFILKSLKHTEKIISESSSQIVLFKSIHNTFRADSILSIENVKIIWMLRDVEAMLSSFENAFGNEGFQKVETALFRIQQQLNPFDFFQDESNELEPLLNEKWEKVSNMVDKYLPFCHSVHDKVALFWAVLNNQYFILNLQENNQVKVIFYEDLINSPKEVFREIGDFCGLPNFQYTIEPIKRLWSNNVILSSKVKELCSRITSEIEKAERIKKASSDNQC